MIRNRISTKRIELFEEDLNNLLNDYGYTNLETMINKIVDKRISEIKQPQQKISPPQTVTIKQLADMCGCSKSLINNRIDNGIFAVVDKNSSTQEIFFEDARNKILNDQANLKSKFIESFKLAISLYK